jgi:hypothetical protein
MARDRLSRLAREPMSRSLLGHLCRFAGLLVAALLGSASPLSAQSQAIVGANDIVVTGFSGAVANPAPSGGDASDYLTIDSGAPSLRVVDVSTVGQPGQVSGVAKPFTVSAAQIGQVFAVALDNATPSNIYRFIFPMPRG